MSDGPDQAKREWGVWILALFVMAMFGTWIVRRFPISKPLEDLLARILNALGLNG